MSNIFNGGGLGATSYDVVQNILISEKLGEIAASSGAGLSIVADGDLGILKNVIAGTGMSITAGSTALTFASTVDTSGFDARIDALESARRGLR